MIFHEIFVGRQLMVVEHVIRVRKLFWTAWRAVSQSLVQAEDAHVVGVLSEEGRL